MKMCMDASVNRLRRITLYSFCQYRIVPLIPHKVVDSCTSLKLLPLQTSVLWQGHWQNAQYCWYSCRLAVWSCTYENKHHIWHEYWFGHAKHLGMETRRYCSEALFEYGSHFTQMAPPVPSRRWYQSGSKPKNVWHVKIYTHAKFGDCFLKCMIVPLFWVKQLDNKLHNSSAIMNHGSWYQSGECRSTPILHHTWCQWLESARCWCITNKYPKLWPNCRMIVRLILAYIPQVRISQL